MATEMENVLQKNINMWYLNLLKCVLLLMHVISICWNLFYVF